MTVCSPPFSLFTPASVKPSRICINNWIKLEDYTDQQLELAILQRLKYGQVGYQEEKVLWLVVEYGHKDLHKIIRLLKDAITIMLADSRTVLTVEDVKKVMSLS